MYKDLVDKKGEYNTPIYLFNYVHKFFNFELDPCDSGDGWLKLPYNYTRQDDGLRHEWDKNAFINPPFGVRTEQLWLKKAIQQSIKYDTINFIILPAKSESIWFELAMHDCSIAIFIKKRINFIKNGSYMNGNTMGSIMFGFFSWFDNNDKYENINRKKAYDFRNFNTKLGISSFQDMYFPDRDTLIKNFSSIQ